MQRKLPAEGTFIRNIYNALYAQRGKLVDIYTEVQPLIDQKPDKSRWSNAVIVLERDYDCEIVMHRPKFYILKAEFIGRDWVYY